MALVNRDGWWIFRRKVGGKDTWTSTGFRVGGKTNKAGASRRMGELETLDRGGELGWTPPPTVTVQAWWDTYRAVHLKEKGPRTQTRDIGAMTHHGIPFFGKMDMGAVKKSDCMRYLEERRHEFHANDGHKVPKMTSEGTVQRERRLLQAIWQQHIADGNRIDNPWRGIDRIEDTVRDRVLTIEEYALMALHLSSSYQRCVKFLLGTGIRIEELRGINPTTDIAWETRLLTVTGKGNKTRQVPLQNVILPVLRDQLAEQGQLWTQTQQRIREVLAEAAVKAKIPHATPHTMRHTYGARWLQGGGDIFKLSKILGHASVAVTQKHYAHLLKEDLRAAADLVDLGI